MTFDPYRVDVSSDFIWQAPAELQSRIELVRLVSKPTAEHSIGDKLRQAINATHLDVKLNQLVTPGDRVALAVDPQTPSLIPLLKALLSELILLGADLRESKIVLPEHANKIASSIQSALSSDTALSEIQVILHHGTDRSAISYLGANEAGDPIYMARALADADVVIPLFTSHVERNGQQTVEANFLYRNFAGTLLAEPVKDRKREKQKPLTLEKTNEKQSSQAAHEAFWLLGVLYGIAVAPGAGGEAEFIFAGNHKQLDQAMTKAQSNWMCRRVAPAGLVIAEISGGIEQQNWEAVGRALELSSELTESGGIVVLLCDVADSKASRKSFQTACKRGAVAKAGEDHGVSVFASALDAVRGSNPVFLKSQLTEEVTEDLGMGFISKPAELSRLIERLPRTILIRDAQHVRLETDSSPNSPLHQGAHVN